MGIDGERTHRWSGGGTFPIACIVKASPLRFTRATVAYNASTATKDAACSSEFGSSYQVGRQFDLPLNSSMRADDITQTYFNTYEGSDTFYWATATIILNRTGGTHRLLCVGPLN